MPPFGLMYRLGLAPWERRDVAESWRPMLDGPDAPPPGRALDIGCGSGRDAAYLASRGWRVTGVEFIDRALASARERAANEGVEVEWVKGDVAQLGRLGLQPGYELLYDFGCLHGLPDAARRGAAAGMSELAAPGATLVILAFKEGRRVLLPRGIDSDDLLALLGESWNLEHSERVRTDDMAPPIRRAAPTLYRLTRRGASSPLPS